MHDRVCPSCGGKNSIAGAVVSTGKLFFKPSDTPFLTLKTNDVAVHANMCLDCGVIVLVGDVAKAKSLTGQKTPLH